jgi:hypothetical protein
MEKDPNKPGVINGASRGLGPVTREMLHARACELALSAGHPPPHVAQANYEQAKRELTGESDPDRQQAKLAIERPDSRPGPAGVPA